MFCQNKKGALGLEEVDGSFAEYVIADSMFTVPIPDNVSFADTVFPPPLNSPILSIPALASHNLVLHINLY
jgi:threonine dehydrogenase-like Zn-dependent dehydrogenase